MSPFTKTTYKLDHRRGVSKQSFRHWRSTASTTFVHPETPGVAGLAAEKSLEKTPCSKVRCVVSRDPLIGTGGCNDQSDDSDFMEDSDHPVRKMRPLPRRLE